MPILEDQNEQNVVECLLLNAHSFQNSFNNLIRKENIVGIVVFNILKNIADYPFDLFKIRLKSVVSELI